MRLYESKLHKKRMKTDKTTQPIEEERGEIYQSSDHVNQVDFSDLSIPKNYTVSDELANRLEKSYRHNKRLS